jgi:predicted GIY-YIG superfamily endonuclease
MSKTNIYILQLKDGKYYIGKSDNVMKRYEEHLQGKGSKWTTMYKPISVVKVIENASPFEEDKITKEYMAKYGISNVRGGSYVSITLDDVQ